MTTISEMRLSAELDQFLDSQGADSNAVKNAAPLRQQLVDPTHNLPSYFISSSHNTYLLSRQLLGKSSAQSYNQVLSRNARCVEMDVWSLQTSSSAFNSSDSRLHGSSGLVLTHGYTFSQAISLESVAVAIKDAMEVEETQSGTPSWPVFVSLECHVPISEQGKLVDIMKGTWGDRLVATPLEADLVASPEAFMGKILVMVEYYPPVEDNPDTNSSDSSDVSDEESEDAPRRKPPHPKINEELASIGYYARSMKPKNGWVEKAVPSYGPPNILINISEPALLALLPQFLQRLIFHSQEHLRRIYPKGTRVHSSNLDPVEFWGSGAQVVSLNWQKYDRGMQINSAMFAGSNGWVLKPPYLRPGYTPGSFTQTQKEFTVEIAGISGLYPPSDCRQAGNSYHVYLVAQLFQSKATTSGKTQDWKSKSIKTSTLPEGSANVMWNQSFTFSYEAQLEGQEQLMFLRFRVKEDEFGKDDILAVSCSRLDLLIAHNHPENDEATKGWRVLKMLDLDGKWEGACLVVKFTL